MSAFNPQLHVFDQTKPYIGCPATMSVGSDRYALVITDITPSGKTLTLRYAEERDGKWMPIDGRGDRVTCRFGGKYWKRRNGFGIITIGRAENYRCREF